jgi:hypothetical protein
MSVGDIYSFLRTTSWVFKYADVVTPGNQDGRRLFKTETNCKSLQGFHLNNHIQAVSILKRVFTLHNIQMSSNILVDTEKYKVSVIRCNINVCISLLTVEISVFLKGFVVTSHFLIALNMYVRIFQRRLKVLVIKVQILALLGNLTKIEQLVGNARQVNTANYTSYLKKCVQCVKSWEGESWIEESWIAQTQTKFMLQYELHASQNTPSNPSPTRWIKYWVTCVVTFSEM